MFSSHRQKRQTRHWQSSTIEYTQKQLAVAPYESRYFISVPRHARKKCIQCIDSGPRLVCKFACPTRPYSVVVESHPVRKPLHARTPKQARSRVLVDAVLDATKRVIREKGWADARVARIAKVAGVSVGSLYRYFPGRHILLSSLIDQGLERDLRAFEDSIQRMQGPSIQDSVAAFIEGLDLDNHRLTDPRLLRHLVDVLESANRMEAVRNTCDYVVYRFSERLLELHPELNKKLVHRRAHMAFWGLRGAVLARIRVGESFNSERFRREAIWLFNALMLEDIGGVPTRAAIASPRADQNSRNRKDHHKS